MASAPGGPTTPPAASELEAALDVAQALLERLYDVIDDASFDLSHVVDVERIAVDGVATPVDQATRLVRELLDGAEDVSVFVRRSGGHTVGGGRATVRATVCAIWSPAGGWDDHEGELDVSVELTREADGSWRLASLAVDPAAPAGGGGGE